MELVGLRILLFINFIDLKYKLGSILFLINFLINFIFKINLEKFRIRKVDSDNHIILNYKA